MLAHLKKRKRRLKTGDVVSFFNAVSESPRWRVTGYVLEILLDLEICDKGYF